MISVTPITSFMAVLSIIQPARIENIKSVANLYLGTEFSRTLLKKEVFQNTLNLAIEEKLVLEISSGIYCITPKGFRMLQQGDTDLQLQNRRLYQLKRRRKFGK